MKSLLQRRSLEATWAAAAMLTVLAATEHLLGLPGGGALVVVMTTTKVTVIFSEFMEIRHAPRWLQALCLVWVAAVATLLLTVSML